MRTACAALLAAVAVGKALTGDDSCWSGSFTAEFCCDTLAFGVGGNAECWEGGFTYERCCSGWAAEAPQKEEGRSQIEVSRTCWRSGFNFFKCCTRARPGGDPGCWDGGDFTFEKCCMPPDAPPSALLFEDVNCEREGADWNVLHDDLTLLLSVLSRGEFQAHKESAGGTSSWMSALRRRLGEAPGECPLGTVAVQMAVLLLCLADGRRACRAEWAAAAKVVRQDQQPSVVQWVASRWPVIPLLIHISGIVVRPDPGCHRKSYGGIDWPLLLASTVSIDDLPNEAMLVLYNAQMTPFDQGCEAGLAWIATLKMSWCARSEVKCIISYSAMLDFMLRRASRSGAQLSQWLGRAGEWKLPLLMYSVLGGTVRHHYTLGLQQVELEALGIVEKPPEVSSARCVRPDRSKVQLGLMSEMHLADGLVTRHSTRCRALCGSAGSSDRFGVLSKAYWTQQRGQRGSGCVCALASVPLEPSSGNCSDPWLASLYPLPAFASGSALEERLRSLAGAAPTLSQVVDSLPRLGADAPVFTTMVFGHMARYLPHFGRRVSSLGIPNVVVFVLDSEAENTCLAAHHRHGAPAFCLRGVGKTALQKYVVVLAYLALGREVFWFDFDSVWLKNPLPYLRKAEATAFVPVYAAIDFDSKNCAMNAFFWLRPTYSVITWLFALTHWIYRRPLVHDQTAFTTLLGIGPLVDDEPLPSPPQWAPLDPDHWGNAARFEGLGFASEVEDLVFFHFFDGWNSNLPSEAEYFATPTYKGVNMFEVLYGDDDAAAHQMINRSKLPRPAELKDCRYMTTLGLGVEIKDSDEPMVLPVGDGDF